MNLLKILSPTFMFFLFLFLFFYNMLTLKSILNLKNFVVDLYQNPLILQNLLGLLHEKSH